MRPFAPTLLFSNPAHILPKNTFGDVYRIKYDDASFPCHLR